jgi:hypothetical protein
VRRGLELAAVVGGDHQRMPIARKAARDLQPDAARGAGHERKPLVFGHDFLLMLSAASFGPASRLDRAVVRRCKTGRGASGSARSSSFIR